MIGSLLEELDEDKESLAEFNRRVKNIFEQLEKDLEDARQEYFNQTGCVREKLAEMGWFLPNYTRSVLSRELRDMRRLGSKTSKEIDEYCYQFYQDRLERIHSEVVHAFPDRKNAIDEAIEAHQLGKYFLSVPVLLIQADGIFAEHSNKFSVFAQCSRIGVFDRERRSPTPKSKRWLEDLILNDEFVMSYMKPLCMVTALNMNPTERASAGITLNRHAVLHGECVDYGTQMNSLKSLSFLYFVTTAIECLKMEESETKT
jgi:hypothetical protein